MILVNLEERNAQNYATLPNSVFVGEKGSDCGKTKVHDFDKIIKIQKPWLQNDPFKNLFENLNPFFFQGKLNFETFSKFSKKISNITNLNF